MRFNDHFFIKIEIIDTSDLSREIELRLPGYHTSSGRRRRKDGRDTSRGLERNHGRFWC